MPLRLPIAVLLTVLATNLASAQMQSLNAITLDHATPGAFKVDGDGTYTLATDYRVVKIQFVATKLDDPGKLQKVFIPAQYANGRWSATLTLVDGRYDVYAQLTAVKGNDVNTLDTKDSISQTVTVPKP